MSLNLKSIFRCMMEDGYYPSFEQNHIQFGVDDNIGVVEYEDDVLSVRLFFSIDEEAYGLFLEASNLTMIETYAVKPAVLDDMKNIMFSCEILCHTLRDFVRFFPRMTELTKEAIEVHKQEMKRLLLTEEILKATMPVAEDSATGTERKILS
jgi:hypothetical protein